MRALLQRVRRASVSVSGEVVGVISEGLLLFVGIAEGDGPEDVAYLTEKAINLRVFPDAAGPFDRSALDTKAQVLAVSQVTLYADTRKGRRPSFTAAAAADQAPAVFDAFVAALKETGLTIATGRFQEHMFVELENDGPVTIMLDSVVRQRLRRE